MDEPKKRDQKWANNRSSVGSERYRAEAHSLPCFNHTSTLRAWLQLGVHPDLSKESFLTSSNLSLVFMTKIHSMAQFPLDTSPENKDLFLPENIP